jgi:hypothetical protein
MKKSYLYLVILSVITLVSCETDIEVNAPYQDISVVYGLIDPEDSVHYIKVNKTFLGDVNALDLAADAANFNYPAGELDVIIEEYNDDILVQSYSLIRTVNEIPKDPGIFDNSDNVLFKFNESSIDRNHTYKLKIINNKLNKEITSETKIVKNSIVADPVNTIGKFQFWIGPITTPNGFTDKSIKLTTAANIGRVDAVLVFNYTNYYTTSSGLDSLKQSVRMPLGELKTSTSQGSESLEWKLTGSSFFDNIKLNVPDPINVPFLSHREIGNISLEFNIAGTELSTFMEVSEPSSSVNQEKPNYTNINNGIGVFSSRTKLLWLSSIDPVTTNQINIQNSTITYLQSLNKGFCFGDISVGFPVVPCTQLP